MASAAPAAAAAANKPPRPYRDFLTPLLHRRFTSSVTLTLVVCYVISVWMAQWDVFWKWFPIGPTGIRTLLLFIPTLAVYILRLAHMHIGRRHSPSTVHWLLQLASSFSTVQTYLWYSFSAWIFCEIYLWSASSSANLSMVDYGRPYERERLNERPIYLRSMFLILAALQTFDHFRFDYDLVEFPPSKVKHEDGETPTIVPEETPIALLRAHLVKMVNSSAQSIALASVLGPLIYAFLLRHTAWSYTLAVARYVFDLPKNSKPPRLPPFIGDLIGRFVVEGFLLLMLWEFVNKTFNIYVAQPPLKSNAPLTNDSKDPNGSLLAGLKAKKEMTRAFAFWELDLIAYSYPARRVSIFNDLDRVGGSAWSQIVAVCLGELHAISKRIKDYDVASKPLPTTGAAESTQPVQALPKISTPLKQDNIVNPPPAHHGLAETVGDIAKAHGNSTEPSSISPRARKLLEAGIGAVSPHLEEQLSSSNVQGMFHQSATAFLQTPVGYLFRQTIPERLLCVVLGTPFGALSPVLDAVSALAKLAVHSKKEDKYGRVYRDVATIIRVYTSTIGTIVDFADRLTPHWTDVEFQKTQRRAWPEELAQLRDELRRSLGELLKEFGDLQKELGLSAAELRWAKVACSSGQENGGGPKGN